MSYIVLKRKSNEELELLVSGLFAATFLQMKVIKTHCNVLAYLRFVDATKLTSVINVNGKLHSDQVLIEQLGDNYVGYIKKNITKKFVSECRDIDRKIFKGKQSLDQASQGAFPKFDELFGTTNGKDCAAALDAALKEKEAVPKLLVRGF